jgi:hypothetical protein
MASSPSPPDRHGNAGNATTGRRVQGGSECDAALWCVFFLLLFGCIFFRLTKLPTATITMTVAHCQPTAPPPLGLPTHLIADNGVGANEDSSGNHSSSGSRGSFFLVVPLFFTNNFYLHNDNNTTISHPPPPVVAATTAAAAAATAVATAPEAVAVETATAACAVTAVVGVVTAAVAAATAVAVVAVAVAAAYPQLTPNTNLPMYWHYTTPTQNASLCACCSPHSIACP